MRVADVPHDGARDAETPAAGGNPHARIIVDIALRGHEPERAVALLPQHGLRREPRGNARAGLEIAFPQGERGASAEIQHGVGLRPVGERDEGRAIKRKRVLQRIAAARRQLAPQQATKGVEQRLRMADEARAFVEKTARGCV